MLHSTAVAGVATALVLVLGACGHTHTDVLKQPQSEAPVSVQSATIAPVEVKSREDDADSLALNQQWAKAATEELQKLMAEKRIAERDAAGASIVCQIAVVYGSRALRYFVGFGAGAGSVSIDIELKDAQGATLYAAKSTADLKVGLFGGDMSQISRDAIAKAVRDFGARLSTQP